MKPNKEQSQRQKDIFANNFRKILELRGKTQADVAMDLEITSSTVSDWANAKKYPRVDKMQTLADYLGVLISDLREEKPTPVSESGPSRNVLRLAGRDGSYVERNLTDEQLAAIKMMIEQLPDADDL